MNFNNHRLIFRSNRFTIPIVGTSNSLVQILTLQVFTRRHNGNVAPQTVRLNNLPIRPLLSTHTNHQFTKRRLLVIVFTNRMATSNIKFPRRPNIVGSRQRLHVQVRPNRLKTINQNGATTPVLTFMKGTRLLANPRSFSSISQ